MRIKFTVEVDGRRVFAVGKDGETQAGTKWSGDTLNQTVTRLWKAYEAAKKS